MHLERTGRRHAPRQRWGVPLYSQGIVSDGGMSNVGMSQTSTEPADHGRTLAIGSLSWAIAWAMIATCLAVDASREHRWIAEAGMFARCLVAVGAAGLLGAALSVLAFARSHGPWSRGIAAVALLTNLALVAAWPGA